MPKVQTTSMKNAENRGVVGEVVCVLGAVVSAVVAMLAAGPLCWQHEPFHAQLNPIGGMVGSLPKPPPIGLTCGCERPGVKWRGRTWLQGPRVPRPGPVGQVARWCETLVAFACLCLCGFETAIAFAGEK